MKKIILTFCLIIVVVVSSLTFHKVNREISGVTYDLLERNKDELFVVSKAVSSLTIESISQEKLKADTQELYCMSLAIYKEVRGEPDLAQIKVSQTIMNRVNDKQTRYFDNSVCEVVKRQINKTCMFSFWCEKGREFVNDKKAFEKSELLAARALKGEFDNYTNATYFKNCDYKSKFFDKLQFLSKSGKMCFYKEYAKR